MMIQNNNSKRCLQAPHVFASMGWECELKPKVREKTLESLAYTLDKIFLQDHCVKHYEMPEEELLLAAEDIPTTYGSKATANRQGDSSIME